ncbi:hypothetical protein ABZ307_37290 [Streptomyces griseorubiginosus]
MDDESPGTDQGGDESVLSLQNLEGADAGPEVEAHNSTLSVYRCGVALE